jgi:hypothetical protein
MSIEDRNLKPGTVLVARHRKKDYRAEVRAGEDGKVAYRLRDGREFTSPSAAGSAVMGGTACNGWRFWSVEGSEPTKATKTPTTAKKGVAKPKAAKKAKAAPKSKARRKVAGGGNGASLNGNEPVEKPVACGACGEEFPTSREAGDHMRDQHGSVEAAGNGS